MSDIRKDSFHSVRNERIDEDHNNVDNDEDNYDDMADDEESDIEDSESDTESTEDSSDDDDEVDIWATIDKYADGLEGDELTANEEYEDIYYIVKKSLKR